MTEQINKIEQAKAQRDILLSRIGQTYQKLKNKKNEIEEKKQIERKKLEDEQIRIRLSKIDNIKPENGEEETKENTEVSIVETLASETVTSESSENIDETNTNVQNTQNNPEIVSGVTVYYPIDTNTKNRYNKQPPAIKEDNTKPTNRNRTQDFNNKPEVIAPPSIPGKLPGKLQPIKKTQFVDRDSEQKEINKKARLKFGGYDNKNNFNDDEEGIVKYRTKKSSTKNKSEFNLSETKIINHAIIDKQYLTIKELSEKIGKTGVEIIKQLMSLGIIKTINETIDFDTADLVSTELGVTIELQASKTSEEIITEFHDKEEDAAELLCTRPPIVTIMGHVDHGKTSILDYIRKAHVASSEAGGITQHIGAYSVKVKNNQITFIDTPGHAAFTSMRERGANVTDIVVIVVAADDGIMPQTIEAINHSKAAGVNIIVAVNKIDKKDIDVDRVFTQLSEQGLVPDEWGGEIPCVRVSAKTGEGIDKLLETILISSEIMDLKANPNREGRGTILEARLDVGKGPIATVIVQNGTLKVGDFIVAGTVVGKIRAMQDEKGKSVSKAGPSNAVAILGLKDVPNAGDNLMAVNDEKLTKQVADERLVKEKINKITSLSVSLDDLYKGFEEGKLAAVNLIIKGDVQGSLEALKTSLEQLSNDQVKVNILQAVTGAINESDVTLAKTTGSIIIGFNVRPDPKAKISAESKNVDIRMYRIIYDAIDDVQSAIKGLLKPIFREEYLGKAEVRVIYKIPGLGAIAGSMVKDGKIVKNANVRLIRNDVVIADTYISSLKRVKDDAKEVNAGFECGIGLKDFHEFAEGDIIESFRLVQE